MPCHYGTSPRRVQAKKTAPLRGGLGQEQRFYVPEAATGATMGKTAGAGVAGAAAASCATAVVRLAVMLLTVVAMPSRAAVSVLGGKFASLASRAINSVTASVTAATRVASSVCNDATAFCRSV